MNAEPPKATIAALLPDLEAAEQAVPDLGRIGIDRRDICVAGADRRAVAAFCERYGVSLFTLADEHPARTVLSERVAPGRARYLADGLSANKILFVLSDVVAGADAVRTLRRWGADFGPDIGTGDAFEVRVPLRGEQLDVEKVVVRDGAVHLRKDVVTEVHRFEVPVVREELVIEHTAGGGGDTQTFRIPLQHEELRITKRTVVDSEIRVRREQHTVMQRIEEPVRSEVATVSKEGNVVLHEESPRR